MTLIANLRHPGFKLLMWCMLAFANSQHAWAAGSPTTTALTVTAGGAAVTSVQAQTVITLSVTVTAGSGTVTPGQVVFCDATAKSCTDVHQLGIAQLNGGGIANLKFIPGPGTHQYNAFFRGTNSHASSTSPTATLLVVAPSGPIKTTVGIQASGGQGDYALLATVATNGPASPTGQVSYLDTTNSNYVLGTSTLGPTGSFGISFLTSYSFPNLRSPTANNTGAGIAVADFNSDGVPDIVVGDTSLNTISLLLGRGDGTFTSSMLAFQTNGSTGPIATGDFNGDGKADFVVSLGNEAIAIYLGNGDGTFAPEQILPSNVPCGGSGDIVVGDFNGDGIADLAQSVFDCKAGGGGYWYVQVLLGNGDGTFTRVPTRSPTNESFHMTLADFNNDGKMDLITTSFVDQSLTVLLGNGDGTFAPAPNVTLGIEFLGIAAADLNHDGNVDLVVTNESFVPTSILLGNGDGTFTPLAPDPKLNQFAEFVSIADFNGDGIPDIVLPNVQGGYTSVFLGKGDGTFVPDAFSPSVAGFIIDSIAIADFNGDGQSDIAEQIVDNNDPLPNDDQMDVLLAQSPSTAAAYVYNISPVGTGNHYVVASYPGDNNNQPGISTAIPLLAEQVPTTLTLTANPSSSSSGQPVTLIATLNQYLAQNHYESGAVTFTSNGKSLGAPSVVNGVATLTVSTLAVGKDNLFAKYPGDTNFTASSSSLLPYIVSTQTAQTITFPQPPSPAYTGTSTTLTATATSNLPVTYTVLSGPATLSGSTLTYTANGTVIVAANQPGNAQFSAAPQVTRSIVVLGRLATIAITATPNPVFLQNPVLLTAILSSTAATPTGSVIFLDGGTPLGSANLTGGVATFSTSTLTLGSHTITAAYSGDSVFAAVVSPATVVVVQDFSLTITNPNVIIPHGGTAVYSLIVGTIGGPGMASTINFSIAGNPDHSPVTFSPSTVPTGAGTTNVSLTIATPDYPVGPWSLNSGPKPTLALLALAALLLPFFRNKTLRHRLLAIPVLLLASLTLLTAISGCGSGWGSQGYSLKVTATSGALSRSASATLTSKPQ